MSRRTGTIVAVGIVFMTAIAPAFVWAGASGAAKKSLEKLLVGKEVRALIQLPATKEGVKVYLTPPEGKDWDQRGLNVKHLTKWLRERGVGVEANDVVTITAVKIGGDMIEIHLGGGGMGRRGSKHAQEEAPGFKRAGGSRINLHYERDITDADLQPSAFLDFMGRILDARRIRDEAAKSELSPEARRAVERGEVAEGMTYQMVLLSWGDPEQKRINESAAGVLSETWFYMKDGRRVVVDFLNGKVAKVQRF